MQGRLCVQLPFECLSHDLRRLRVIQRTSGAVKPGQATEGHGYCSRAPGLITEFCQGASQDLCLLVVRTGRCYGSVVIMVPSVGKMLFSRR
jgi:hypothetical protein